MKHEVKIAHSMSDKTGEIQDCDQHFNETADRAAHSARKIPRLVPHAKRSGLLHDWGKLTDGWQDFARKLREKGGDHAALGAMIAFDQGLPEVAMAILGTHVGIPNRNLGGDTEDASSRIQRWVSEHGCEYEKTFIPEAFEPLETLSDLSDIESELATRFIFSCLAEADIRNTKEHFEGKRKVFQYPPIEDLLKMMMSYHDEVVEASDPTDLNMAREELFSNAMGLADGPTGIYTLNAPTGLGKTLTMTAFALKHASLTGKDRVIVVMPFLSIVRQTAKLFKKVFGEDNVVEHHSSIEWDETNPIQRERLELAAEDWDAPIIITTAVQFYESLFGNMGSRCRKNKNIANSVVINDEVQSLPHKFLHPIYEMIEQVSDQWNTTFILSSATQNDNEKLIKDGATELCPDPIGMSKRSKRVEFEIIEKPITHRQLANMMKDHDQALCVVNSKKDARKIWKLIGSGEHIFHLSSRMTNQHISMTIDEIDDRLKRGLPCLVISTQLIEAGVHIDFPIGFRAMATLHNLSQFAGRINRDGVRVGGKVIIFTLMGEEIPGGDYLTGTMITRRLLDEAGMDIQDPKISEKYSRRLSETIENDPLRISKSRIGFLFREVAKDFVMIEEGQRVVIENDETSRTLRCIRSGCRVTKDDVRTLQPHMVSLSHGEMKRASGDVESISKDDDILIWRGEYDDDIGIVIRGEENEM